MRGLALVVGGAGFIGSHLVQALKVEGDSVSVLDPKKTLAVGIAPGDWSGPRDVVYHLAAEGRIQPEFQANHLQDTFMSTVHALRFADLSGAKHFVFTSSGAVYGDGALPISVYGACKLGAEGLVNAWRERTGNRVSILRLGNVVGPRCRGVIPDLLRKLKADPTRLDVCGDGSAKKPFIHISDVVNVLLDPPTGLYDVRPVSSTSVQEVASMCSAVVARTTDTASTTMAYGEEARGWVGDIVEPRAVGGPCIGATMTSTEAVWRAVKEVWEGMK